MDVKFLKHWLKDHVIGQYEVQLKLAEIKGSREEMAFWEGAIYGVQGALSSIEIEEKENEK